MCSVLGYEKVCIYNIQSAKVNQMRAPTTQLYRSDYRRVTIPTNTTNKIGLVVKPIASSSSSSLPSDMYYSNDALYYPLQLPGHGEYIIPDDNTVMGTCIDTINPNPNPKAIDHYFFKSKCQVSIVLSTTFDLSKYLCSSSSKDVFPWKSNRVLVEPLENTPLLLGSYANVTATLPLIACEVCSVTESSLELFITADSSGRFITTRYNIYTNLTVHGNCNYDDVVKCTDINTANVLQTFPISNNNIKIRSIVSHPFQPLIALGYSDNSVRFITMNTNNNTAYKTEEMNVEGNIV